MTLSKHFLCALVGKTHHQGYTRGLSTGAGQWLPNASVCMGSFYQSLAKQREQGQSTIWEGSRVGGSCNHPLLGKTAL